MKPRFEKFNDMYIFFNDNEMQYGFLFEENLHSLYLKKFVQFCDNLPKKIFLPAPQTNKKIYDNADFNYAKDLKKDDWYKDLVLKNYFEGSIMVCSRCFDTNEDLTLVVPKNYSIMFDYRHNSKDSTTNLILPEDSKLFAVNRRFSTVVRYEHEAWPLVAHKDSLNLSCGAHDDHYVVHKFDEFSESFPKFTTKIKDENIEDNCSL